MLLKEYLESIKDLTPEKNELTHRAFLQKLLTSLKDNFNKEFKIEHESKGEKGGGVSLTFLFLFKGLTLAMWKTKEQGLNLTNS